MGVNQLLCETSLFCDVSDRVVWISAGDRSFYVKDCYAKIMQGVDAVLIDDSICKELKFVWETKVQEKIKTFGLRLLKNNFATCLQLRACNGLHVPHDLGVFPIFIKIKIKNISSSTALS